MKNCLLVYNANFQMAVGIDANVLLSDDGDYLWGAVAVNLQGVPSESKFIEEKPNDHIAYYPFYKKQSNRSRSAYLGRQKGSQMQRN